MSHATRIATNREPAGRPEKFADRLAAAATRPWVLAIVWVAVIGQMVQVAAVLPSRMRNFDFSLYYVPALALREGVNPYTTDLTAIGDRLHLKVAPHIHADNSPLFLLSFEPFTLLTPATAYWIWFAINVTALGAAMVLLLRGLGAAAPLLAALMLLYPPVADNFFYAQTQLQLLLMLVLMWRWLEEGHDVAAGLMFALAGALRVFPLAIGGYLLLRRRWRALASAAAAVAVLGAATVAVVGLSTCAGMTQGAAFATQYRFISRFNAISLYAFISRVFHGALGTANPGYWADALRRLSIAAAQIAVLIFSVRATLAGNDSRAFSIWIATAILLSPLAWPHYMALLLILFVQLAIAAKQGRCSPRAMRAMVASYLLMVITIGAIHLTYHDTPVVHVVSEGVFVSMMLAYLSAYWLAVDRIEPAPRAAQEALTASRPASAT